MKKTFKVTVTLTTDVVVEIDTDSFNEAAMEEFRQSFYKFTTYEQHARHIAQYVVRFDNPGFLEGYGPVKYDGKIKTWETDREPIYDINLKVGEEGVETEIEEVQEPTNA